MYMYEHVHTMFIRLCTIFQILSSWVGFQMLTPVSGSQKHVSQALIWKPQKVYNHGIDLVYTRHMTIYSIYLEYTWYIPVI